jgi:hypothetical protein
MNKINLTALFLLISVMISCVGPEGPQGPIGPEGEPGINILGTTYEVEIDFTSQNDYFEVFNFPVRLEDSDAVLVYRLVGVENNRDIWRLLPQFYFFESNILIYNFDYSNIDFGIFLDGNIQFSTLGPQWRLGQVFRVIVVPADFASSRIDFTDYEAVMKLIGATEEDVIQIQPRN